jgi:hypothetical protein
MARVLADYLIAIGWGVVGAVSMACGLGIRLRVFDWLTPIDEWEEIRKDTLLELGVLKTRLPLGDMYTPEFTPVKL